MVCIRSESFERASDVAALGKFVQPLGEFGLGLLLCPSDCDIRDLPFGSGADIVLESPTTFPAAGLASAPTGGRKIDDALFLELTLLLAALGNPSFHQSFGRRLRIGSRPVGRSTE